MKTEVWWLVSVTSSHDDTYPLTRFRDYGTIHSDFVIHFFVSHTISLWIISVYKKLSETNKYPLHLRIERRIVA